MDQRLNEVMTNIYAKCKDAAQRYDMPGNLIAGATIAGFEKVAETITHQGVL